MISVRPYPSSKDRVFKFIFDTGCLAWSFWTPYSVLARQMKEQLAYLSLKPAMTASLCVLFKFTNHRTIRVEGIRNIYSAFQMTTYAIFCIAVLSVADLWPGGCRLSNNLINIHQDYGAVVVLQFPRTHSIKPAISLIDSIWCNATFSILGFY